MKNDSDFDKLNQIIPQITEAPIATLLNNPILDPALTKYFFAAQLIIQYLTFCLQCLDQAVSDLHMSVYKMETEKQDAAKVIKKQNDDLNYLQKKLNRVQHSCKKCSKTFVSEDMLDVHITRKHHRHQDDGTKEPDVVVKDMNLINTIKLELEVKHLKERLNNAEKVPSPRKAVCSCCCNNEPRKNSHEIGIQSNLGEQKEADDNITDLKEQMEKLIDTQFEMMQKWKTAQAENQTDVHKHGEEVELITQKFDHLLTVMENMNENFQTIKAGPGSGNDETISIKSKIMEIEKSQQLSHRKIHESLDRLDLDYVEKLGDIQIELGKISKYLADEKTEQIRGVKVLEEVNSVPQTTDRAVQHTAIVHHVIESESGKCSACAFL
jgi:zinc finger protein DZIP1